MPFQGLADPDARRRIGAIAATWLLILLAVHTAAAVSIRAIELASGQQNGRAIVFGLVAASILTGVVYATRHRL